jgi:DNA-binding beta-propeller fold protein YncE
MLDSSSDHYTVRPDSDSKHKPKGKVMRKTLAIIAWVAWAAFAVRAQDGPYKLVKEIQVGGEGGWDYLSVDSAAKRLYVSHATKAVVIDISKDAVVGEIPDTPGIHGAIAVPPDRVFTSNGRGNNVSIVDAKTLQLVSKVDTEGNPDGIMYEPKQKEVYTFNGRGMSASVINAASGKVVATIPLGGAGLIVAYQREQAETVEGAVTRAIQRAVGEADGRHVAALKGALADAQEKMAAQDG